MQELWRVLLKYLTPVSKSGIGAYEQAQEEDALQKKLRINFIKHNQTIYAEIAEALAAGDIKLAHRLAHTLKGNAGQIGKSGLQNAAAEVEALLNGGTLPISEAGLELLKSELMLVLEELEPLLHTTTARERHEPLNAEQILALFEKLEPLLENINPACVNLLDDIRAVPGTEELARLIENYDFKSAARTLVEFKKKLVQPCNCEFNM
jgi:HPt (histidine-containing phosphotransfer) domain-containing protein